MQATSITNSTVAVITFRQTFSLTFSTTEDQRHLASTKLYCLVTEAHS